MAGDLPDPTPSYLSPHDAGCLVGVRVIPRAGRSALAGVRHGSLLVRLAAAPVDGAANEALLALLADALRVPRRALALVSGERSRDKRVLVGGLRAEDVARRIAAALDR